MSDPVPERTSPLAAVHSELGASFTDFAGWQMPVRYTSDLAEHAAVRNAAGIFDLSHMAEILVYGRDAGRFLDFALAGRLSSIDVLQAKYSLLLTEAGGILDDVVVYRLGDTTYLVVANAGNRDAAAAALSERAAGFEVTVDDQSDDYALIAVQGPNSRIILEQTTGFSELSVPLDELRYYRATDGFFNGVPLIIARTGYTGEDGFELYLRADAAVLLWRALEEAGEAHGLAPAGLASRDTLRLEAGMPLYGHELGTETFPVQAALGRVVALSKEGDFVGRAAVEAGPADDARALVGLTAEGRRAGRAGYPVVSGDSVVGTVTSGALSPTLGHPIMMAYVDPAASTPGTELAVDVRGTRIPATVTTLPFYRREK
ncbi:glycine cleavage system aminomethyltransferase GcvT [Mycetocola zhujimingii]|uniref:Aminomethyltransferase n=1 Tax=Mycetocola zhujimingii TaxID=2079792 RepID=A0A2U1THS0_9MICO|nr:glycine cleavage system aminomethyltransferase GcvT [Mycetocola zhujimingii]PWC08441.1 glycine cleavage system aminomethyltransferase GcvT [Mycetocola zhujimingii]